MSSLQGFGTCKACNTYGYQIFSMYNPKCCYCGQNPLKKDKPKAHKNLIDKYNQQFNRGSGAENANTV